MTDEHRKIAAAAVAGALLMSVAYGADSISAADAANNIGKTATVCGVVASARFAEKSKGQPTFLNFDKAYPDQVFTVLIRSEDRSKFGTPETKYAKAKVCVTGSIQSYQGRPEMIVHEPAQITIR